MINLLCLLLVVGIHEFGHYIAAVRKGVHVTKFGIGFGIKLIAFMYKGTEFSLRLIPLGGFITMDHNDVSELSRHDENVISFAGPYANLLTAMLLSVIMIGTGMIPEFMSEYNEFTRIMMGALCTALVFFCLVPLSFVGVLLILIHPIESLQVVGPITLITNPMVSADLPIENQILSMCYLLSITLGAGNLMPFSLLDGGRIFKNLFYKFPKFVEKWEIYSTILLVAAFLYTCIGDILYLFL